MGVSNPVSALRIAATRLTGAGGDYDDLLARVGDAPLVLLGEATHGTHEFYRMRAEITKRLIREKGFSAVAVEADWPDAHRVHRYVIGRTEDQDAERALSAFERFPRWMWRNADVLDFVGWLRSHNDALRTTPKVGFYGLDLYSLHSSIAVVLGYLDSTDPAAAKRARERYRCFEGFSADPQLYGLGASLGLAPSCEAAAIAQLQEMQQRMFAVAGRGDAAEDAVFFAEQNARLVSNAEAYYRSMVQGNTASWNLRDEHMADTIDVLIDYLSRRIDRPKIVVWEHNSHLGDARATRMGAGGQWNVGQLVRERDGAENAVLVGFSTYEGTVTAASNWDMPAELKRVRPALAGSWEELFHQVDIPSFLLITAHDDVEHVLRASRLGRAIGVIYRPDTERASHYYETWIGRQFDAILHVDRTRAVEPLDRSAGWRHEDAPETYPFAV